MRRLAVIFITCLAVAGSAWAAGITKSIRFTVLNSQLGGYKATPGAGWKQDYSVTIATSDANAASVTDPKFVALLSTIKDYEAPTSTVPPSPSFITVIGPSGAILQKEQLPSAYTVTTANCKLERPSGNTTVRDACPFFYFDLAVLQGNPNRVMVKGYGQFSTYQNGQWVNFRKTIVYMLDPNAPVGSTDRWRFIVSENSPNIYNEEDNSFQFQSSNNINTVRTWMIQRNLDSFSVYTITNK